MSSESAMARYCGSQCVSPLYMTSYQYSMYITHGRFILSYLRPGNGVEVGIGLPVPFQRLSYTSLCQTTGRDYIIYRRRGAYSETIS